MKKDFQKYTMEDFLDDAEFCSWVRKEKPELDTFYVSSLKQFPEQKENLENARRFIELLEDEKLDTDILRKQQIWEYANKKFHAQRIKTSRIVFFRVAASIIVLLALSSIFFYLGTTDTNTDYITSLNIDDFNETRLILNDGEEVNIQADNAEIVYAENGEEVKVNQDMIKRNELGKKAEMNHLIVPYGKQSKIVLADGTTVWLNAGSSLSYPADFYGDIREVHLQGEAFFDVISDRSKPFYVITNDMKIRVTGTTFNVTSYANDNTTQTVLLSGKVSAMENKRFSQAVELVPGERIVFHRGQKKMVKDKVNVELYSSWRNGYLIFDGETLQVVLKKLERYYDKKLNLEIGNTDLRFSGKLNLDANIEEVLENISYSIPFTITTKENYLTIKIK